MLAGARQFLADGRDTVPYWAARRAQDVAAARLAAQRARQLAVPVAFATVCMLAVGVAFPLLLAGAEGHYKGHGSACAAAFAAAFNASTAGASASDLRGALSTPRCFVDAGGYRGGRGGRIAGLVVWGVFEAALLLIARALAVRSQRYGLRSSGMAGGGNPSASDADGGAGTKWHILHRLVFGLLAVAQTLAGLGIAATGLHGVLQRVPPSPVSFGVPSGGPVAGVVAAMYTSVLAAGNCPGLGLWPAAETVATNTTFSAVGTRVGDGQSSPGSRLADSSPCAVFLGAYAFVAAATVAHFAVFLRLCLVNR